MVRIFIQPDRQIQYPTGTAILTAGHLLVLSTGYGNPQVTASYDLQQIQGWDDGNGQVVEVETITPPSAESGTY